MDNAPQFHSIEQIMVFYRASEFVWPDDVLDRVEYWINAKHGGDADVRSIAAALIACGLKGSATPPNPSEEPKP